MGKLKRFCVKQLENTIDFLDRLVVRLGGTTQADRNVTLQESPVEAAPQQEKPRFDAKAWDASNQVLQAILTGDEVSQEEIQELEEYWAELWERDKPADVAEVWEPAYIKREKTEEQQKLEGMWEREDHDISDYMDIVESLAEHIKAGEFDPDPGEEKLCLRKSWGSNNFDLQKWSENHQAEVANPHTVQSIQQFRQKLADSEKTLYPEV